MEEVLAHPFFQQIDLNALQQTRLPAPAIPKLQDLDELRASQQVTKFSDLEETAIPGPKIALIQQKMEDFEIFGEFTQGH